MRQRFVLDTTALTDVQTRKKEGYASLYDGMSAILDIIAEARLHLEISCYVPYPTVYSEIRDIARRQDAGEELLSKIDTWLVKKTPDRFEVKIPAEIFHDYVDYMRSRINKGMVVAEEAIRDAARECLLAKTKAKSKKDIEEKIEREVIGGNISKFRNKYRNALRYGILDSTPDIDVLLLAKELDAAVVAADHGIRKWAERLGLRYVDATSFPAMINEYLRRVREGKK
ncbi:MAG: RNA ligase partner protein [Methanocellales archaeon]|nr:RNA ligase partner protein [Methanocellales archaeon]